MQGRHFTEAEAAAKVGTRVRSLIDDDPVLAGTTGFVVARTQVGSGSYYLTVEWDLTALHGRLLLRWINKNQYERFLEEVSL